MILLLVAIVFISKSCQENLQWSEWSRLSACSVTCGNGFRYQHRECTVVDSNTNNTQSLCQGYAEMKIPCVLLACPKVEKCNCGCRLKEKRGRIVSTLSYDKPIDCYWSIETGYGTQIKITILDLKLPYGFLLLTGNNNFYHKIMLPKEKQNNLPLTVITLGNLVNISLHDNLGTANDEIRFLAEYEENLESFQKSPQKDISNLNIPAISGITACVSIILIASCIIGYKKYIKTSESKDIKLNKEEEVDKYSSTSSSNRSSRNKPQPSTVNSLISHKNETLTIEQQKLLQSNIQRGYPEGGELYTHQPNYIIQPYWAQGHVNGNENYVIHSQSGSNYVLIPGPLNGPPKV